MNKTQLVEVFENTQLYSQGLNVDSKTTKHTFEDIISTEHNQGEIVVINSDTVSAGVEYAKQGKSLYKRFGIF